jgi:hypothetical protein
LWDNAYKRGAKAKERQLARERRDWGEDQWSGSSGSGAWHTGGWHAGGWHSTDGAEGDTWRKRSWESGTTWQHQPQPPPKAAAQEGAGGGWVWLPAGAAPWDLYGSDYAEEEEDAPPPKAKARANPKPKPLPKDAAKPKGPPKAKQHGPKAAGKGAALDPAKGLGKGMVPPQQGNGAQQPAGDLNQAEEGGDPTHMRDDGLLPCALVCIACCPLLVIPSLRWLSMR